MQKKESYFDGNVFQKIGWIIVCFLIIVVTAGIGLPWAMCIMKRWETKHTVIDGRRLRFDGTAVGLFGKWLLWLFLIIITVGIYAFFVTTKLKKWVIKHTHFATSK